MYSANGPVSDQRVKVKDKAGIICRLIRDIVHPRRRDILVKSNGLMKIRKRKPKKPTKTASLLPFRPPRISHEITLDLM
jgi:hypothetical protein